MDNIPQWLIKKDNYRPGKDKDAFVDKSILSIFKVLSRMKSSAYNKNLQKVTASPAIKLLLTVLIVLTTALSNNIVFIVITDICLLVTLSLLEAEQIAHIFKVTAIAVAFSFIILLPSMIMGNIHNSINIMLKIAAAVTAVNLMASTTRWHDVTSAMKVLKVPDLFIFVLDLTLKYIALLGELALEMLYALKKRNVGVNKEKNTSLSSIMGTMFIKSKDMAEEMQGAMECRGFVGEYKHYSKSKSLNYLDFIMLAIGVIIVVLYVYFGWLI